VSTPFTPVHADALSAEVRALLRREVGLLRRRETRRRFDTEVTVGRLDGERRSRTVPRDAGGLLDPGTRAAVVAVLLEQLSPVADRLDAWIVRPGEPSLQDQDLGWFSAADRAFAEADVVLDGFWTVTRTGWLDVRSGERRTWKRLRL
jgi:hypothetical protein